MQQNDILWQSKVAARLHDPAEKALVLLRDPAGHEGGTSRALSRLLGLQQLLDGRKSSESIDPDNDDVLARTVFPNGVAPNLYSLIRRADWWAAAADRPQWPMKQIAVETSKGLMTFAVADWAQVRWTKSPELIHPLTGDTLDLGALNDTDVQALKQKNFDHVARLLKAVGSQDAASADWRKVALTLWRFGPEVTETGDDADRLGALWHLLPADTRVPDHSIWDHLDLTSAFAGAFAADAEGEAALLTMALGPVQSFIATARSTSDLWAGSHLLSRLAWECMRPVAEELGPDAILFPRLRGVPQVDMWLLDSVGLPSDLFAAATWSPKGETSTDANPLFAAALPNRFVAVVPASQAKEIAERCVNAVRVWLQDIGQAAVDRMLKEIDAPAGASYAHQQMREQLEQFPEVHWAAVPFSLIKPRNLEKQTDLDIRALQAALAQCHGSSADIATGFLASDAWKILQADVSWQDNTTFFKPNPGVLYPAIIELAECLLAASKSCRSFDALPQKGWRESLSGESEWLTTDPAHLYLPPGQRTDTLWTRLASRKKSWVKPGEHLGGLSALKRLWPTLFAEEIRRIVAVDFQRFVVSTHTMALAKPMQEWLERGALVTNPALRQRLEKADVDGVALPRKLAKLALQQRASVDARRLPALLEATGEDDPDVAATRSLLQEVLGGRPEAYFSLVMMDGDKMGAILSGDESTATVISYQQGFHSQVRSKLKDHASPAIQRYSASKRAVSPNRHLAISGALNDFSLTVARHVVEEQYCGRLIYAGGDDVLAMLPVADVLGCIDTLQHAYSGVLPDDVDIDWQAAVRKRNQLHCKQGFALLNGRLMRMMGKNASASCGVVIAHHQAPMAVVMNEVRSAEKRAKTEGGRAAFSITLIKRAGGVAHLTAKWGDLALLQDLIEFLQDDGVSRRAVYHSLVWLDDLPDPSSSPDMLQSLLAYQLNRQSGGLRGRSQTLAQQLVNMAKARGDQARDALRDFMVVAEFLARESRGGEN